ncbi:MAG: MFS transporter [Pseudomonadota bacterium]
MTNVPHIPPETAQSDASMSKNKAAIGILMLTIFLDLLGFGVIIPLLPDYARSFGATAGIVGALVAGYSLMQFIFGPILGALSDRIGRRPVLLGTIAVNGVAFVIFGLAGSLAMLFAARLVSGIAAANLSVAQASLADITPPAERAKVFGLIGAAFGMGFVFGPPLGALIAGTLGSGAVGFCVAALCALNFVSAFLFLRETRDSHAVQASTKDGGLFASLREVPAIRRLFAVMFLFTLGFSVMPVIGALIFADRFGLTAVQIGYVFTLIGVATAGVQAAIGPLAKQFGERSVLLVGLVFVGAGIASLPFVPVEMFLWLGLPALVIYAFGHAFVYPTLTALVAAETDETRQGTVLGQLQAAGSLALVIGPLGAGYLYDASLSVPFMITGAVLLIAVFIAASHPRNRIKTS